MSRGGFRENAGSKKGTLKKKTIETKIAEEEFRQRVLKNKDKLFNAQFDLALGTTYLYKIVETGKGDKLKREHVIVTDPNEIKDVLDECDGDGTVDDTYYYMTTKAPDNKAIDSMLDRTFGKAKQGIELTGKEGGPIEMVAKMETELKNWK